MRCFLMIGQSNMAGRGVLGEMPPIENDKVFMLSGGEWKTAREPVNRDRDFSGEGMQIAFADQIQRRLGGEIGLIPCADGGTALSEWMPGERLFERAVETALIAMRSATLSGIAWHQGENDAVLQRDAQSYALRFLTMLDALTGRLNMPSVPTVVGELGEFVARYDENPVYGVKISYSRIVNEQLRLLPALRRYIGCVSSEGLTAKSDNLHFDTTSLRVLGTRYAEAWLALCESCAH